MHERKNLKIKERMNKSNSEYKYLAKGKWKTERSPKKEDFLCKPLISSLKSHVYKCKYRSTGKSLLIIYTFCKYICNYICSEKIIGNAVLQKKMSKVDQQNGWIRTKFKIFSKNVIPTQELFSKKPLFLSAIVSCIFTGSKRDLRRE